MIESKLLKTIKSFSEDEQRDFDKYLRSGLLKVSDEVISLYQIIQSQSPNFDDDRLKKRNVFSELFPNISFHDKKIRVLMSALYGALKTFLVYLEIQDRTHTADTMILSQLRKRNLPSFNIHYKVLEKKLETQTLRDEQYHFVKYEMALEANGFFGQKQVRELDHSLQEKMQALDAWYLCLKLKETCEMLNREKALAIHFENPMIELVTGFLEDGNHDFWEVSAVKIYYQIYRCLSNEAEEVHYYTLIDLLNEKSFQFPDEEARGMYKHAQNYCIRKINSGETQFLKEILHLYKMQLENGIIFFQDELAHTDYKNIVTVGLRLKEFDWVEKFIYQYKEKVQTRYRENVFTFNLAAFYYEKNQFQKVIQLLKEVKFTDVFYETSARLLLLKVYYEAEELESAIYQVQAFSIFLKRNKSISVANRTRHLNFLKLYKKLVEWKEASFYLPEKEFEIRLGKLKERIYRAENIVNLDWLKEKIES